MSFVKPYFRGPAAKRREPDLARKYKPAPSPKVRVPKVKVIKAKPPR